MWHGVPIALGYISVSFGFGIMAVQAGLSLLQAVGISATNLTSAGQVAGVTVIAAAGTLIEMALTQLVINLRYALMGISLTQKLSPDFGTLHRLVCSFGITDEVFAVASSQPRAITPAYMYGLIIPPIIGWSGGTLLGAAAGEILPEAVSGAMGIVIYGMFIAIIVPPARKDLKVLTVILFAAGLSLLFTYVFTAVPAGFSIIICALVSSALGAALFPVKDEEGVGES